MRALSTLAAIGLAAWSATAAAQSSDARFQREVLERLERIERLLSPAGAAAAPQPAPSTYDAPAPRVAGTPLGASTATNLRCGPAGADCVAQAAAYCRRAGYGHGVPSRIETRGQIAFLVNVTCVE